MPMSSPQMTRMFGFESGMCLVLGQELWSFSTAWSTLKLAGGCRGGNSLNVSRNIVAIAVM